MAALLLALPPGGAAAAPETVPDVASVRVVVCGPHHRVLPYWIEAAEDGRLPRRGVTVVHFDAHPDLALPHPSLPPRLPAPAVADRFVDIASFQLAAVWWGLVDRVIWVRPSWATQIPDGERRFRLGRAADGRLRVDDTSDYYVLDDAWSPGDALRDAVQVEVRVLSLEAAVRERDLVDGPWILDVDLDGFATRSPAADTLRQAGVADADLTSLRRAFAPERLALPEDPSARIAAVEGIERAAARAAGGGLADALSAAWTLWRLGVDARGLWTLYRVATDETLGLPPERLFAEGRSVVGSPEHRATPQGIAATAEALAALAGAGGAPPPLVTVARSVHDGFTPADQWPEAEWAFLRALARALGPGAKVQFDRGESPAPAPR